MDFRRRLKRIEDRLNVGKEPVIIRLVYFGDGQLPPERTERGIIYKPVHYKDTQKKARAGKRQEL